MSEELDPTLLEAAATEADVSDKFLDTEDLLRIELSQTQLQLAALTLAKGKLDDKFDELNVVNAQLTLQVKAHELSLQRLQKQKELTSKLDAASKDHSSIGEKHEALKKVLGEKYGIPDWSKVAYDDLTGKLTVVPELVKES